MKAFWALAARHWVPSFPSWEMAALLGRERVAGLLAAGLICQVGIAPFERVTCTSCRGDARVVWDGHAAVAICDGDLECPAMELGSAPFRWAAHAGDLARSVATALALEGAPGSGDVVIPLGWRKVGDEVVAFDLCPNPRRRGFEEAFRCLARGGPTVRVMLVPDSARIAGGAPREIGGTEVVWAGLDEVMVVDGGVRADLRPILERRRFTGVVATEQFAGLEVRDDGASWRGVELTLTPRALRLLRVLVERREGGARADLWRELWPEDHTRRGELARAVVPEHIDARLRKSVGELRAVLGRDAVVNARGGDRAGGYRLAIAPELVRTG